MLLNRAKELVNQFQQAHQEVVTLVISCPDARWLVFCEGENETISALVNHIALGYPYEIDLLRFVLEGATCPTIYLSQENLDQFHAKSSQLYANRNKEETLNFLRQNGAEAVSYIGSLSDEDLRKNVSTPLLLHWYGRPPTVERVVKDFLIGHHAMHIDSLKQSAFNEVAALDE